MHRDKLRMLQCCASAKAMLLSLGIERSLIPKAFTGEDELAGFKAERIERFAPLPPTVKRLRRTKAEMKQLREFEAWQLRQRSK